jgi:hypothetical protein
MKRYIVSVSASVLGAVLLVVVFIFADTSISKSASLSSQINYQPIASTAAVGSIATGTVTTTTATSTWISCSSSVMGAPEAPIYIVIGQSNAWGLGIIKGAASTTKALTTAGWPFSFWAGTQTSWASGSTIQTAQKGSFGPDLNISNQLTASGKSGFYVFKYAVSNTSLATNWGSRGTKGLYDKAVGLLKKAEGQICASGKNPVVKAVFWMQGETDASNQNMSIAYQKNLQVLVDQSRQDYLGSTAPFIIGLIDSAHNMWPYAANVRKAEQAVGSEMYNGYIETNDLEVYPGKNCGMGLCMDHYDTKGQLDLGNRFYQKYVLMGGN